MNRETHFSPILEKAVKNFFLSLYLIVLKRTESHVPLEISKKKKKRFNLKSKAVHMTSCEYVVGRKGGRTEKRNSSQYTDLN